MMLVKFEVPQLVE